MKELVYKLVLKPALICDLQKIALKKRQEAKLEVAELKMLRFSFGVTTTGKI